MKKLLLKNLNNKLRERWFIKAPALCVFVNDKPISALNDINTKLKNDDEILFFIPISGG